MTKRSTSTSPARADSPAEESRAVPADFRDACDQAGVRSEDREALWRVVQTAGRDSSDPEVRSRLFADYEHWRTYEQSRQGDAAAANRFERHWRSQARAFFGERFGVDETEELIVTFFERVYRLVGDTFAWPCPFRVYLRSVLVNLARDHVGRRIRTRQREVSLDSRSDGEGWDFPSDRPSPEEEVLSRERLRALESAIWDLPPVDRHLMAAVLAGRSGAEVADELSLSRDAVYQRVHRAREQLKAKLQSLDLTEDGREP